MSSRQPPWNKFEAVILLDGFLSTLDNSLPRKAAISNVSADLRKMAENIGLKYDDTYRNEAGITFMMHSMESAFLGKTLFKPATQLFTEVVSIYRNSPDEYRNLLKEAKAMINGNKSVEEDFMRYLADKVSPNKLSELYFCYPVIEKFCINAKVLTAPLFETTDIETVQRVKRTIERNKIFYIKNKWQFGKYLDAVNHYYDYINEGHFPKIEPAEPDIPAEPIITPEPTVLPEPPAQPEPIKPVEKPVDDKKPDHIESATIDNPAHMLDLTANINLSFTKPVGFKYFDEDKFSGNSWTDLYVAFVATIYEDYPHFLKPGMYFSDRPSHADLSDTGSYSFMRAPKRVPGTNLILETNLNSTSIAKKIKYILDLCNVDYENIVITYIPVDTAAEKTPDRPSEPVITPPQPKVSVEEMKQRFSDYLLKTLNMMEKTRRSYVSAVNVCDSFARTHISSSSRLFTGDIQSAQETAETLMKNADFRSVDASHCYCFSAALKRYLSFLQTQSPQPEIGNVRPDYAESGIFTSPATPAKTDTDAYIDILRRNFAKGFRLSSPLEIRKFRKYYSDMRGCELADSDNVIVKTISSLCVIYEGKAYLPDAMVSDELYDKLFGYIDKTFAKGTAAIYYQALYDEFAADFLDSYIYNADMLKEYLARVGRSRYHCGKSYISKSPYAVPDALSEVRAFIRGSGRPVRYDEIFAALPHLPQNRIKQLLSYSNEFISNGAGVYFHIDLVHITDDELEGIARIISDTIAEKEFIGANELYDVIKAKYSHIIDDNLEIVPSAIRDIIKIRLGTRFSFKGNIISAFGYDVSMPNVFAKYAKSHDSFSLSSLQSLASNLETNVNFDMVYANSLRISREQFVSRDQARFDTDAVDAALKQVCVGNYMPIRAVVNFGGFPYPGFPWNSFLLEHYVADFSRRFKLIHNGFNATDCVGAIVKRGAMIDSLEDLFVDVLITNQIEPVKDQALDFLAGSGYLARRQYAGIESVLLKVRAKQWKDKD